MLVNEVMTSPALTVGPHEHLKEVARLLEQHSITAMPVVDHDGALVGVVSEADVIQDAVLPDPRAHEWPVRLSSGPRLALVSEVMSRHVLSVPAGADLAEAADLMVGTAVKSLPVVEHGKVVGVISRRDVIRVIARRDELMEAELDELVRAAGEDWTVDVEDGVVLVGGPETEAEQGLAQALVCTVPGVVGIRFQAAG